MKRWIEFVAAVLTLLAALVPLLSSLADKQPARGDANTVRESRLVPGTTAATHPDCFRPACGHP
jgi:hypothetical protein